MLLDIEKNELNIGGISPVPSLLLETHYVAEALFKLVSLDSSWKWHRSDFLLGILPSTTYVPYRTSYGVFNKFRTFVRDNMVEGNLVCYQGRPFSNLPAVPPRRQRAPFLEYSTIGLTPQGHKRQQEIRGGIHPAYLFSPTQEEAVNHALAALQNLRSSIPILGALPVG